MKTILKNIFFCFCLICATSQSFCQNEPFLFYQENINLPKDNLGVMPEYVVEVDDIVNGIPVHKLYVYGMQGLLIYNLNASNWEENPGKIELTNQTIGYYDRSLINALIEYPGSAPMLYLPLNMGFGQLFVVGPDLRLWYIDVIDDNPHIFPAHPSLTGYKLISTKLVFDQYYNRLVWLVNGLSNNSNDYISYLFPVDLSTFTIQDHINSSGLITDFAINDIVNKNVIYIGGRFGEVDGYWAIIERDDFTLIESIPLGFVPGLIKYVHDVGLFYAFVAGTEDYFSQIYFETEDENIIFTVSEKHLFNPISSIKLVSYPGNSGTVLKLFISTWDHSTGTGSIWTFEPGANEEPIEIAQINSCILKMDYNDQTGLLYLYGNENNTLKVIQIDVLDQFEEESEALFINTMPNDKPGIHPFLTNEMLFENKNHLMYIPNGECSSISRLGFEFDRIHLSNKLKWLSFPRLNAVNVDARSFLNRISPLPANFKLTNVPLDSVEASLYIEYQAPEWTGDLTEIQSLFGYKMEIFDYLIHYLPMTGNILDPETPITIYPRHENWVGYFLPHSQDPLNAIPTEVLANLKSIFGQYWSCYNNAFIAPPPKSTATGASEWKCLCNQGKMELSYSDMVIMNLGNDLEPTFIWNQPVEGGAIIEKGAPEYFGFFEQPDYEAIYLELDSIDLPDEIGAFAGDSCIGATIILPDDTAAMICAYTQGFEDEEISFELMYSTKSTRPVIDDYLVFNDKTRMKENRKIIIGEKQPFYLVSFHKNKANSGMINPSRIHCLPNPAKDEATIVYFIPGESKVQIRLSNSLGKEVMQWNKGKQTPGNYQVKLNTSELPAGYYLVGLYSEYQICIEKLLIVH